MKKEPFTGIFDSGVGGLTVLSECMRLLPAENFYYFADSGYAPYGERSRNEISERCFEISDRMIETGAKAILVACNTATSSSIKDMRRRYSIPIVGMEPALKPAVEANLEGNILVLGTSFTIRQEKYSTLLKRFEKKHNIISLPCPGLVRFIERGDLETVKLKHHISRILSDIETERTGAVVLGCTHYVYLKDLLRRFFPPEVRFFDGNEGTARRLQWLLQQNRILSERKASHENQISIDTSGDALHVLPLCNRLLKVCLNNFY